MGNNKIACRVLPAAFFLNGLKVDFEKPCNWMFFLPQTCIKVVEFAAGGCDSGVVLHHVYVVEIRMPGNCAHARGAEEVKFSLRGLCSLQIV